MININNLSFAYQNQNPIIDTLKLNVKKGEFIVLCGKSGCGKSTLLRILNGLIPELYSGHLKASGNILNYDIMNKSFNEYVKHIGVVFQNPKTQFFTSDVYSELAFSMENYGFERDQIINRIQQITNELSLQEFLNQSMFNLSGGQKQLIAFASSSMLDHQLFLLDEPSSNLDEETIEQLKSYLKQLKEKGMTIIISEHRLHYLNDLADRFIIIDNGKISGEYKSKEMNQFNENDIKKMGLRSLKKTKLNKINHLEDTNSNIEIMIDHLNFSYKKNRSILNIKQLILRNNNIIGIIGHNGAGKSTFTKLISGLLKPSSGTISLNNKIVSTKDLIKESFVVMQDVNLQLFFETVEKEITLNAKNLNNFGYVIEKLHLSSLLHRHPQTLSGGEAQRVAIASALLSGKKIIILDEPTSGLDLLHMEEVSETIKWLNKNNILVLIISHDLEFLNETCQRIIQFDNGKIIDDFYIGKEQEIKKK